MEVALSKRRTERLLSIVVLLLSSRRYLTAEQIRAAVSGYPEEQESFKRMFERDKEELRDLGIPLETGRATHSDDDLGYRISRQDYELPEIHLEPDEAAVLGIASRVWQSAELAGAATGAALKLRAASGEADGDGRATPPPGSTSSEFGILRTFANEQERDAFYASPLFQAWKERIAPLTEGEPQYRQLHGLEAWFRSPQASRCRRDRRVQSLKPRSARAPDAQLNPYPAVVK